MNHDAHTWADMAMLIARLHVSGDETPDTSLRRLVSTGLIEIVQHGNIVDPPFMLLRFREHVTLGHIRATLAALRLTRSSPGP